MIDVDAAVFAGGGCRCFWQAGFWTTAAPALGLTPRAVGAVSAGAAFACASLAGIAEPVVAGFARRVAANRANFYPGRLVGPRPAFPHEQIYRATILEHLDADRLDRLRRGPDIRVLLARAPRWLPWPASVATAAVAYHLDRRATERVHAAWGQRLGFRAEIASVRECRTPGELADLILHSSCTPPVTRLHRRAGRLVLDGGLIDNAPVLAVAGARRALVLLTRHVALDALPRVPGRLYVAPSRPIPISSWDYTSPGLVRDTFDLGRFDGDAFARAVAARRRDEPDARPAR